jgi:hypothetical protein
MASKITKNNTNINKNNNNNSNNNNNNPKVIGFISLRNVMIFHNINAHNMTLTDITKN